MKKNKERKCWYEEDHHWERKKERNKERKKERNVEVLVNEKEGRKDERNKMFKEKLWLKKL